MKKVFFYFDDSGVLHEHEKSGFFVYAGYVFLNEQEREIAQRKYISANKKIKRRTGRTGRTNELKAATLENKHKRALCNVLRKYESVSAAVENNLIYHSILSSKLSICRYKDYILKICVKRKLEDLIERGKLNANDDIHIIINIDEQRTATNGYYRLQDSIMEELQHGISNWDYGVRHPNVFHGTVNVTILYKDSKKDYLIQAGDLLANRIWTSYWKQNASLREISNLLLLTFP